MRDISINWISIKNRTFSFYIDNVSHKGTFSYKNEKLLKMVLSLTKSEISKKEESYLVDLLEMRLLISKQ